MTTGARSSQRFAWGASDWNYTDPVPVGVSLDNVSVEIPILGSRDMNLKGRVARLATGRSIRVEKVAALRGVEVDLSEGDRVALVGRNGGGKSTLLRVIAGILPPSQGLVRTQGRIASMLDANLGMDQEATGYENILLRGIFLGESRQEMLRRTAGIAEFSGLGDRLAHPIYTYSAGMRARLSFSIATSIDSDILLVDEGIGTADAEFTQRAKERLANFYSSAGILVLASHAQDVVRQFCTKGILLEKGEVLMQGAIDDVLAARTELATHS